LLTKLCGVLLFATLLSYLTVSSYAYKIDNTHYRYCVMDNASIVDQAAVSADQSNQLPSFPNSYWYGYNGVLIKGELKEITVSNYDTSISVLMTKPYSGKDRSLSHRWDKGYNGMVYDQTTYFYIEVDAPSGVTFDNLPQKMVVGDCESIRTKLTGSYTSFSGSGYFNYVYSSSNPEVISVSSNSMTAVKEGNATISVKAYAKNHQYSGSYYIGECKAEIEVIEEREPTSISLNKENLWITVGESETLTASISPEDSRTEITWNSSDSSVAEVIDGKVTALKGGEATITATTSNNLVAECQVNVLEDSDYLHVKIDDLYYDIDRHNKTASVVPQTPFNPDTFIEDWNNEKLDFELYNYIQGAVSVPSEVEAFGNTYNVISIGDFAFCSCDISSIEIPSSVTSIGDYSFFGSNINTINMEDGLKSIGNVAFALTPLELISLPSSLISIGDQCFQQCEYLNYLDIPEGVESIGFAAFYSTGIESVYIPKSVTAIGYAAFSGCNHLEGIYIDNKNLNYSVYNNCLYDRKGEILLCVPGTQETIMFLESTKHIAPYAACYNSNIHSLEMPFYFYSIGEAAFAYCENLEKITFGHDNYIETIDISTFEGCTALRTLNLPDYVKQINDYAFYNCIGLQEISFGPQIKYIQESAFGNCEPETITIDAVLPPQIQENTFTNYDADLIVPKGRVLAYKNSNYWKKFLNISDSPTNGAPNILLDGDEDVQTNVYDLNGMKLSNSESYKAKGIKIVKNGNSLTKILCR
ncbi:MAG: leucine-rich repeat protein, partial [Muribaculaceae bacterium]|nr:leucine-rich repeat protein [Muribaculaceae bacterium]